jgi:hypothetical protein
MRSLAERLSALPEATGAGPWPDHEYVRGWGVFGLPFDSGHVLALRVFPQSTFGPYRTVWHRDPDGRWAIYADAPDPGLACPRYYGPACTHQAHARVDLTWTGPSSLRVEVDQPALTWTLTAHSTPALSVLNATSRLMPLASWRPAVLRRARQRVAARLGMGQLELAGTMPSGHEGLLMPQRMYLVDDSVATLDGADLGRPAQLSVNPTIGGVPLPARGVLAEGQATWRVLHLTRERAGSP